MMMSEETMYYVNLYDPRIPLRPQHTETHHTERTARQAAARMLGHTSLRGAARWPTDDGITYQFGPRLEDTDYEYVVITCKQ